MRRSTFNMNNLDTAHRRKSRFRLHHIVENDCAATVITKWKLGLAENIKHNIHYACSFDFLQLYKQNVLGEVREFIPLIIKTIVLQPSMQARSVLVEFTFKLICVS